MRTNVLNSFLIFVLLVAFLSCSKEQAEESTVTTERKVTKRVGMVIGIKPERIEEYKKVHDDGNQGVRDLLTIANMENFSIFLHQFDNGKYYLFGYYEYTGNDFEADMAEIARKERNIAWLKVCDPMQIPFEGKSSWSEMEQVYYNK
jgi:L-rhamnose mutarotase